MQLGFASRREVLRVSRPTSLMRLKQLDRCRVLFLQLLPGTSWRRCQHLRRDGPDMLICLHVAVAWLDPVRIVNLRNDVQNAQISVFLSNLVHLLLGEDRKKVARRNLVFFDRWALLLAS